MPGKTQRKHVGDTIDICKKLKRPLYFVAEVMPTNYNGDVFLTMFKELYPHDWNMIEGRCKQSREKDAFLRSVGKKERYKTHSPEAFFFAMPAVKRILSPQHKMKHKASYDENIRNEKYNALKERRHKRNVEIRSKISKNTELMQIVEPYYIDALIFAYRRRGITTEEKMEIVVEMGRYICDKTIRFFYQINYSERNNQIRNIAFKHLQKCGQYVKLRKGFQGKQKSYMTERTNYNMTPEDLKQRLDADTIQGKKRFGAFMSHSYKDVGIVKKVVRILNEQGVSCYCDWTSDNDFLKRALVSEYTKEVLKVRIAQSDYLFFIRTDNSMTRDKINSPWIEMELDHAEELNKDICYIDLLNDGVKLPYRLLAHNLENGQIEWSEANEG